jgi:DNA polymerase-3 subunit epsilon
LGESEAIKAFIDYLGNAVIVGCWFWCRYDQCNIRPFDCGRLKNEALDIDIMHRKLNDITSSLI